MSWTNLVLTYAPLEVALLVPVCGTLEVVVSVLSPTLKTVLADHLHPLSQ